MKTPNQKLQVNQVVTKKDVKGWGLGSGRYKITRALLSKATGRMAYIAEPLDGQTIWNGRRPHNVHFSQSAGC